MNSKAHEPKLELEIASPKPQKTGSSHKNHRSNKNSWILLKPYMILHAFDAPFVALWSSSTSRLSICMNCPRIIDIKQKKRSLLLPHWYQLPHFGWKTVLMVMAVLGLWDILLPSMHRPPHLPHLPLLYLKKMCAMWINLAMMEVDYCCHHLHHATSWVDQKVCMWFKFDTTLPWTWLISTHFVEGIERK